MKHEIILFAGLMLFLIGPAPMLAQTDSSNAAIHAAEKGALKNWWLKNPATQDTLPPQWLFHVEANYSFNFQSGNIAGVQHNGLAKTWLRKGLTTLAAQASVATQKLSVARGTAEVTSEDYRFSPTLNYAISSILNPEVGFFWEQNSASFIDVRRIGYGGVRLTPYTSPSLVVSVLPAFGHLHEQALLTGETQWFWAPYIEENVEWEISERVKLHHEANFLVSAENSETFRARMVNTVELPITSFFSVTLNHEIRYDNNPIPTSAAVSALTNGEGEVYKTNNDLTIGFRLQH